MKLSHTHTHTRVSAKDRFLLFMVSLQLANVKKAIVWTNSKSGIKNGNNPRTLVMIITVMIITVMIITLGIMPLKIIECHIFN